jgi:hypothetical protein
MRLRACAKPPATLPAQMAPVSLARGCTIFWRWVVDGLHPIENATDKNRLQLLTYELVSVQRRSFFGRF